MPTKITIDPYWILGIGFVTNAIVFLTGWIVGMRSILHSEGQYFIVRLAENIPGLTPVLRLLLG